MGSAEHLQQLWHELASQDADVELEPLVPNANGRGVVPIPIPPTRWQWKRSTTPPSSERDVEVGAQFCRKWPSHSGQ